VSALTGAARLISLVACLVTGVGVGVAGAGSISGTVTSGGSPLQGVQVYASSASTSGNALTNGTGNYTISGLPAGQYVVRAEQEGFATTYYPGQRDYGAATPIVVTAAGNSSGINLVLSAEAGGMTGTVVDATNGDAPLAGADIQVMNAAGTMTAARAR
jgi:carboxypeptidase family protein